MLRFSGVGHGCLPGHEQHLCGLWTKTPWSSAKCQLNGLMLNFFIVWPFVVVCAEVGLARRGWAAGAGNDHALREGGAVMQLWRVDRRGLSDHGGVPSFRSSLSIPPASDTPLPPPS